MAIDIPFQNIFLKINIKTFEQITHLCLDDLCGRRGAKYENFTDKCNCSVSEFSTAVSEIKSALNKITKLNSNENKLPDVSWSDLDPSYLACLYKCVRARPSEVYALRTQNCASISAPTLKDFDWKVKWILGSSSLASLQQPLLSLDLQLSDGALHNLEMDSQELAKLVASLEQARDVMQSKTHQKPRPPYLQHVNNV